MPNCVHDVHHLLIDARQAVDDGVTLVSVVGRPVWAFLTGDGDVSVDPEQTNEELLVWDLEMVDEDVEREVVTRNVHALRH